MPRATTGGGSTGIGTVPHAVIACFLGDTAAMVAKVGRAPCDNPERERVVWDSSEQLAESS